MNTVSYNVCFETLANKLRMDIINSLRGGEMGVSELAAKLGAEQSTVSHALEKLKGCGFVECRQEGKLRIYSLEKKLASEMGKGGKPADVFRAIANHLGKCPKCFVSVR